MSILNSGQMKHMEKLIFNSYQALQSFRILRNPERLDLVLALSESLLKRATMDDAEKVFNAMRWTPEAVTAVEDRYRINIPSIPDLLAMPENSLGKELGRFLQVHGIDPANVRSPAVTDDLSYVAAHLAETHDIWHLLTGFSPDLDGEAGIAAFSAAQYGSPFQYSIIAGTLLTGLQNTPWELKTRMELVVRGWEMGQNASPLFGIRWDRLWEEPLQSIRERVSLA